MCVKDTGTKYQLWISDFNIDGTFTRIHPFIISHTKTMTRTREDGKEEVFSACIKTDDTRYLGGNKSSSVAATKLQGRPRTGINYNKANEFCANRGDWITMIDYLEYCALQVLCYIEYANFDNQAALNTNLTSGRDKTLFYSIHRLNHFPINFKITKYDWHIYTKSRKEKVKPQT